MRNVSYRFLCIVAFVLFVNLLLFRPIGSGTGVLFFGALWIMMVGLFGGLSNSFSKKATLVTGGAASVLLYQLLFATGQMRTTLSIVGLLGVTGYLCYLLMKQYFPRGILESALSLLGVVFEYMVGWFRIAVYLIIPAGMNTVRAELRAKKGKEERGRLMTYVMGILVGLPVVWFMTSLLVSGDPIFSAYVHGLVSQEFWDQLPGRLVISGILLVILLPTTVMKSGRTYRSPLSFVTELAPVRELSIVVAMVMAVLSTYLAVQWPYIFATVAQETSLSQFGVATYSEYVNKGFVELTMVAFVVFAISWISFLAYRSRVDEKFSQVLLILQALLGVAFVTFIVSIVRRVLLYTAYHGLSISRIYGLLLLLWLMGMVVTLVWRYVSRRGRLAIAEIVWTASVYFLAVGVNWHNLVLRYPPTVNGKVDNVYLARTSADGYMGWLQSYDWARTVILERGLENKSVLVAEDRRDIYYAGEIVTSTATNFDRFIKKYGTDEEIRAYFRAVLESNGIGFPDTTKELARLHGDDWKDTVGIYPTYSYGQISGVIEDYSPSKYDNSYGYQYAEGGVLGTHTALDRAMVWNGREKEVYRMMSRDISIAEMIGVMQKQLELRKKIATQQPSERSIAIDIAPQGEFSR